MAEDGDYLLLGSWKNSEAPGWSERNDEELEKKLYLKIVFICDIFLL